MCHSSFCSEASAQSPPPRALLLPTHRTRPRARAMSSNGAPLLIRRKGALHVSPECLMLVQMLGRGQLSSHLHFRSLSSCLFVSETRSSETRQLIGCGQLCCMHVFFSPSTGTPLPRPCLRLLPVKRKRFLAVLFVRGS